MNQSPYQTLLATIEQIKAQAQAGNWDGAALLASTLRLDALPVAKPADRAAIEAALAAVAEISENAETLHGQTARLLAAFSKPQGKRP